MSGVVNIDALIAQNSQALAALNSISTPLTPQEAAALDLAKDSLTKSNIAIQGVEGYLLGVHNNLNVAIGNLTNMIDQYSQIHAGIESIKVNLDAQIANLNSLKSALTNLNSNLNLLNSNLSLYIEGVNRLVDSQFQLSEGLRELQIGSLTIEIGMSAFSIGIEEFSNGLGKLNSGASEVAQGINLFKEKILSSLSGINGCDSDEMKSFASEKNGNIDSLQFIIKTEGIEKVEKRVKEEEKKKDPSIIDKFLDLF